MIMEFFITVACIIAIYGSVLIITNMIRYPINSIWKSRISVQMKYGVKTMEVTGIIMRRRGDYVNMWIPQIKDMREVKMDDLNKIWIRVEE